MTTRAFIARAASRAATSEFTGPVGDICISAAGVLIAV
jgi:hypothetical protein